MCTLGPKNHKKGTFLFTVYSAAGVYLTTVLTSALLQQQLCSLLGCFVAADKFQTSPCLHARGLKEPTATVMHFAILVLIQTVSI